jgi:hypothetical protein
VKTLAALALLIAVSGCSPKLGDGPCPSFNSLKGLRLDSVEKTSFWVRGRYEVRWTYKGSYTTDILDRFNEEAGPAGRLFEYNHGKLFARSGCGVYQLVEVGAAPDVQSKPGGWWNNGVVIVTETPLLYGPMPTRWWPEAVAANPPGNSLPLPIDGKTMPAGVASQKPANTYYYVLDEEVGKVIAKAEASLVKQGFEVVRIDPAAAYFRLAGATTLLLGISNQEPYVPGRTDFVDPKRTFITFGPDPSPPGSRSHARSAPTGAPLRNKSPGKGR